MGKVKAMFQEYGTISIQSKHYLGVDPGQKGGMCIVRVDGAPVEIMRMPKSAAEIIDWIVYVTRQFKNLIMVVEKSQVMPKQGIVGAFRYGAHFGIFSTVAVMLRVPYHEVRPIIWKKALGLSSNKLDSISACRRIFPTVELVPDKCRKESDGIAEALLIAQWARQKNL
jgi:crossover junction endodeoxyribonuclease RuvC